MNSYLNKTGGVKLKLNKDDYYDFKLYYEQDEDVLYYNGDKEFNENLLIEFDFNSKFCSDKIYSSCPSWFKSLNYGLELTNIGFVGMDNGLIPLGNTKDEILNNTLRYIYPIDECNDRFFVSPINGHSRNYNYDYECFENYVSLKGGFFQGFYKLFGYDYQVLPERPELEWGMEFVLEPKDYITRHDINKTHPNNKGIFFYMGLKQENKLWYFSKRDEDRFFNSNDTFVIPCLTDLNDEEMVNMNGYYFYQVNTVNYKTDNKFLIYHRGEYGASIGRDNISDNLILIDGKPNNDNNKFLTYNRTENGFNLNNNVAHQEVYDEKIDVIDDIVNNGIAFIIKDDGSIGFRTLTHKMCKQRIVEGSKEYYDELDIDDIIEDCDSGYDKSYEVLEGFSQPNIVTKNKKHHIFVRYITSEYVKCINHKHASRLCRLQFYVNGKLVYISPDFYEPIFRPLDEIAEKQETVPFNISIGGGTLGLLETVIFDNCTQRKVLPIEQSFCGSFIGDIYKFKMYDGRVEYNKIVNNYKYEKKPTY